MGRLTLGTQKDQAKPISRRNREILALESSPLRSLSQEKDLPFISFLSRRLSQGELLLRES